MIRTLIVDDSPTVRARMRLALAKTGDFVVVGECGAVREAIEQVSAIKPDLVLLDVYLQDGMASDVITEVLKQHPVPIVLISDAPKEATEVFAALSAGALDFVSKADLSRPEGAALFLDIARSMTRVQVRKRTQRPVRLPAHLRTVELVIIASSAGGPGPLRSVISALPATFSAPVVVCQHIADGFEAGFASWLASSATLRVKVGEAATPLEAGTVVMGKAAHDLFVESRTLLRNKIAAEGGFHPSADRLTTSAVKHFGANVLLIVLSGMGRDGLAGARALREVGGDVWAQSVESAAVSGMPASVTDAGLVSWHAAPEQLGKSLAERALPSQRQNR